MTSKEALKTLKGYLGLDIKAIELLIPIAKDLEVLEIIKAHIETATNGWYIDVCSSELKDTEQQKIKEWLENE